MEGNFRTRIEFIGVEPELQPDGHSYLVDFPTHGDQRNLNGIIGLPILEKKVASATKRTENGFVCLDIARDHKRMMAIFEDHLSGREHRGNIEALDAVPVRKVDVIFSPTFFLEEDEGVSMIRVFVISKRFVPMLCKERGRFKARHERHNDMMDWAAKVAGRVDDEAQKSSDTAYIWSTTLKTSYGAVMPITKNLAA